MRRGLMLLIPGEYGESAPLPIYEACGIRWDDNDRLRFLSKCQWEAREVLERNEDGDVVKVVRRCLIWRGAKSRGGAHRAAGRTAGNKQWYGSFSVKGKTVRAHKFAAVALHGLRPGPDDEIDHNCYNTLCVFCLECVPKVVNQGRIRRRSKARGGNVQRQSSTSTYEGTDRVPFRPNCCADKCLCSPDHLSPDCRAFPDVPK